jgi:hypothetical protein
VKIEICTVCRRNYTAEGVCVPCQQEHGLPGSPYRVLGKSSATIPKAAPGHPLERLGPDEHKRSPATPQRPQPEPHNLDQAEGLEPPIGATGVIFDALDHFAFLTPHCWPSEALLAEWTGYSRMTVVRAKAWLRDHGWINWERAWHPGSRWQHCRYTILAGWHRPLRKVVLRWLDKRRSRANVALSELPRPYVEKETQRSKPRKVRNGWSTPWQGWTRRNPPPKPAEVGSIVISADFAARAGSRERAEAFATWAPAK